MSKRNLNLLIIALVVIIIAVFGFLYFRSKTNIPGNTNSTGSNFLSQFNPFGNGKTTTPVITPPVNVSGYVPPATSVTAKLIKISSMPIAGYTVFQQERLKNVPVPVPSLPASAAPIPTSATGTVSTKAKVGTGTPQPPLTEFAPALRYVARADGNIYETFADNVDERKFSGTVIPEIYEARFGNTGLSVVMRYLKTTGEETVETFLGALPKEYLGADTTTVNNVTGSFLPENITSVSVSPDDSSLFYLFNSGNNFNGNIAGVILNLMTNKKTQIFNSPFSEWLPNWPSANIITLTTKPASGIPGYMYEMSASGKNFNEVLGGINGLTTLASPDGKLILYADDSLSLFVYNTNTKTSDLLGVKTLPEKCVWSGASDAIYCAVPKSIVPGAYPDAWYKGEVSFNDQFWKIDLTTGTTT
ncbi:MAG: hypothetical protein WAN61_04210, partial [Minisyncoccia bacterium]